MEYYIRMYPTPDDPDPSLCEHCQLRPRLADESPHADLCEHCSVARSEAAAEREIYPANFAGFAKNH